MPKDIQSKTGSAPIMRQGHTATNQFGTNPDVAKPKGRSESRDLNPK